MFSQSEGMEGDGSAETQYTYYPASIADATTGTMVTTVQASDTLLGQTTPTGKRRRVQAAGINNLKCSRTSRCCVALFYTGQLYVMMSPQEVLTGSNQRTIAPRTQPYIALVQRRYT